MTSAWRNTQELEGAVIGAMFLRGADPEVLDIISRLPGSAFSVRQYREIYSGICHQARGSKVIDPLTLCEKMPGHEAEILAAGSIPWAKSSLPQYVEMLIRNAALRDAETVLEKALENIRSAGNGDMAVEALEQAQHLISSISVKPDTVQPVALDELLPDVIQRVDARMQGLEEGRCLLTGIDDLDAKTGGLDLTDLVFIAARPSMGKTELALDIIEKVSGQGLGVLFFSLEMANIQITERMVSAAGGMPVSRLKAVDRFEDEDWARLTAGVGRLTNRPVWMVDASNLTIEQICQVATRHQLAHPETSLVVVDYLGLIKLHSNGRHDLAVGEVSKGLKNLAKANKTPVVALSQLSRGVESRPNKRPMNSDLKNSGEIEADADLILMLYRDEVYNENSPAKGIAEINVTKQRNGELGTIYRRFYNGHFLPVDQEEAKRRSMPQPKTHSKRYSQGNSDETRSFT
ncbi:DnaB-like helicase C-terminal domain-containing protein [Pseudescherichia sp.]|uniref:replicative DNA helicase n=1 Tax=Pseudescherichia sp. TaxID=2055881 RepID=UPI00289E54D3|nr:DnaB-like helicase C-terminal domain-containing protein [Pseudescherichia sp.]